MKTHPYHISEILPDLMNGIKKRQAEYILNHPDEYTHDEVAEAQTILHSKPVEQVEESKLPF